jgi:predicted site-specific integrase-resolvase
MQRSDYAKQMGVCYETAWRWYRDGEIQGRSIEVVNQATNDQEDLMADLTAILYSFTAHLYGQRRAKRKTEAVIRVLEAGESEDTHATG